MQYFSTNRISRPVSFREAVLTGQPDDKGLYFPDAIPYIDKDLLVQFKKMSNGEVAFEVIRPYVGDEIPDDTLRQICIETVDFPFPLVEISEQISVLELFHGPTLAFKDVGARFMSRCLKYFSKDSGRKTVVIVATSGDTGGAVANGFHNVDGVEVVILYPKGKVSTVQELQLTTLGGNVITMEIRGDFDDCQKLAKQALADEELKARVSLTSANSINVGRWLPQQFYYFFAVTNIDGEPPVISVPSGNFGNLAAGMLANASGLAVGKFIAACNANDVIPRYFETGMLMPRPSVATISNAMDVGDPSNFVRVEELADHNVERLRESLEAVSISDEETIETMRRVYADHGYVLDPHGAVAYAALYRHLSERPELKGIILETAHPVKFETVHEVLGTYGSVPSSIAALENREKVSIEMDADYDALRSVLLERVV